LWTIAAQFAVHPGRFFTFGMSGNRSLLAFVGKGFLVVVIVIVDEINNGTRPKCLWRRLLGSSPKALIPSHDLTPPIQESSRLD
jgi:hypothetical protein